MKKTNFEKLTEFHKAFDALISEKPNLPDSNTDAGKAVRDLRIRILTEEFEEYLEGEKNNDIVEIADALADIVYIAYGTAVAYGIPLDEVFDEVHRSNMSKLDENGKAIKRDDGKVLKSALYSPPDIETIIDRHRSQ
jgi:predicted HAD superfamily Cof-like phosphohydrolase